MGVQTFGLAYRRGRRPAPNFAHMLGAGLRPRPTARPQVSNAADVTRDIPLGDTFKTIKPLSPKIHSFARSCRTWAVDLRYRIRVFLSKAGTVVAE